MRYNYVASSSAWKGLRSDAICANWKLHFGLHLKQKRKRLR